MKVFLKLLLPGVLLTCLLQVPGEAVSLERPMGYRKNHEFYLEFVNLFYADMGFYFSLTELYLKQCVLKYSKDPFEHRCFDEYQAYTEHTYTRAGRSIPREIQQEINVMRKAIGK